MLLSKPPDPVLLTRSLRDATPFSQVLRPYNWPVLGCPGIEIVENPSLNELSVLSGYFDWIIFNSRYSVHILFELLKRHSLLEYFVKAKRICVVGPETAKVVQGYGVQVDYVPDVYAAAGIVKLFKRNGISRQQILLTAGDKADTWLMKQLDALGNQCTLVEVYKNHAPKELPAHVCDSVSKGRISCLAVTSPSAIFNLLAMPQLAADLPALLSIPVASMGPKITEACSSLGFNVIVESATHTLKALAESIVGVST